MLVCIALQCFYLDDKHRYTMHASIVHYSLFTPPINNCDFRPGMHGF